MSEDLNYLFNEVSLYTKTEFKIFKLEGDEYLFDKDEILNFLKFIGISQTKLITYCHLCKKEFPFSKEMQIMESDNDKSFHYVSGFGIVPSPSRNIYSSSITLNGFITGQQPPFEKNMLLNNKIWYIKYFFRCTNVNTHNYMMFLSVELKNGSFIVRKIGQNPSILTIKGFDFDIYKKQLKELNAYEDYKKADLSNVEHFYVGAYAYLRRIFEKMINKYTEGIQLKDNHMTTKIEACKSKFDPRIHNTLTNLYGILSKSIHELDEEDSKEYYQYLKAVIDIQLQYVKTEFEKQKQSKELDSVLSTIASKFKQKGC